MVLTEKEARTKWCPFTRVKYLNSEVSFNRYKENKDSHKVSGANCIASECMVWKPYNKGSGKCGLVTVV